MGAEKRLSIKKFEAGNIGVIKKIHIATPLVSNDAIQVAGVAGTSHRVTTLLETTSYSCDNSI